MCFAFSVHSCISQRCVFTRLFIPDPDVYWDVHCVSSLMLSALPVLAHLDFTTALWWGTMAGLLLKIKKGRHRQVMQLIQVLAPSKWQHQRSNPGRSGPEPMPTTCPPTLMQLTSNTLLSSPLDHSTHLTDMNTYASNLVLLRAHWKIKSALKTFIV